MTRIGFITSPLTSAHSVRGVGFYTSRLLQALNIQCSKFNIQLIEIKNPLDIGHWTLDIVHYPYFDLFSHTLPITKKTKTVVTIHDVIPLEFPDHYPPGLKGWLNLQLQRLALSGVEGVITDSFASVQSIRKHLQVPHEKIKLVYLAADEKFKKISKPKNNHKLPEKFVLYVGDINYNKNIPNLISACKLIDLPLVIVGKQASFLDSMDLSHPELSHLQNIDWANVIRLGFVDDLVDIYNLATAYCQPSLAEGFGLPVLEALACGTPVVCSDIPGFHEIASNAAAYFDPYNIESIAVALKKAKLKGDEQAQASKFSWSKTAENTLLTYQEIA